MKSKHHFPSAQYIVAVTRGKHTKYFYGERLKDAVSVAGLKPDECFSFAHYPKASPAKVAINHGDTYSIYV